jgi:uncharacterized caspase-like protein
MIRILTLTIAMIVIVRSHPAVAADEPIKQAFVVGNSQYEYVSQIPNPENDARAVAATLHAIGFQTTLLKDAKIATFQMQLAGFLRSLSNTNLALFYYAGHGVAINGVNYLVPVDARIASPDDVQRNLISLSEIINGLSAGRGRASLIILDACRNNPFEDVPEARGIKFTRGLSEVLLNRSSIDMGSSTSFASGTLIAFGTGPGSVAADGNGDHSPFTSALLRYLPMPGLEVNSLFNRVRQDVLAETSGAQLPWSQSAMIGDLYLAGKLDTRRTGTGRLPPP